MVRPLELAEEMTGERMLLCDRIRNTLTDEIASGALPPGTALDEQLLAARFGSSRTPVREALRQLAVSGLTESRPRRGVIVMRMTAERIMNMYEAMAEIEAACVRLATFRMTPVERGQLIELHHTSQTMASAYDFDAYDAFNRQFHEKIYRATHNDFLAEQAISIRARLSAFRRTQLREGDRILRSRDEHDRVMTAISECDGDRAAQLMRAHMLNAAAALGRYIAVHEARVPPARDTAG